MFISICFRKGYWRSIGAVSPETFTFSIMVSEELNIQQQYQYRSTVSLCLQAHVFINDQSMGMCNTKCIYLSFEDLIDD